MTNEESQELYADLAKEAQTLENQLREIATEKDGDFQARVEDVGDSTDDVSEELASLDQRQAMVIELKKRYKEVKHAIEKIKSGNYGKCENCAVSIKKERLLAMPVAALCINCAKILR